MAKESRKIRYMTGLSILKVLWDFISNPILSSRGVGRVGHELGSMNRSMLYQAPLFFIRRIWSVILIEKARLLRKEVDETAPLRQSQVGAATDLQLLGREKEKSSNKLEKATAEKTTAEKIWAGLKHRRFLRGRRYPAVLIGTGIIGAAFDLTVFDGFVTNYISLGAICVSVAIAMTGAPHLLGSLPNRHQGFIDPYASKNPSEDGRDYNPRLSKVHKSSYAAVLIFGFMVAFSSAVFRSITFFHSKEALKVWDGNLPSPGWVFLAFLSIGAVQLAFVILLSAKHHDPEVDVYEERLQNAYRDYDAAVSKDTAVDRQIAIAYKTYTLAGDEMDSIEKRYEQQIGELMYEGHCFQNIFAANYTAAHEEDESLDITSEPPTINIPAIDKKQKFEPRIPRLETLLGTGRHLRLVDGENEGEVR